MRTCAGPIGRPALPGLASASCESIAVTMPASLEA